MSITNKSVTHKQFGRGVIISEPKLTTNNSRVIDVQFPNGDIKPLAFPNSFSKGYLSSDDSEVKEEVEKTLKEQEEQRRQEIERKEKKIEDIRHGIKNDVFLDKPSHVFIVHQGNTFAIEYEGGYLWAGKSGIFHHENMKNIQEGDIIFHYCDGIVAISEALTPAIDAGKPNGDHKWYWDEEGYEVYSRYQLIEPKINLDKIKNYIIEKRNGTYSSFDKNGDANQGYLYELELDIANLIKKLILANNPSPAIKSILNRLP